MRAQQFELLIGDAGGHHRAPVDVEPQFGGADTGGERAIAEETVVVAPGLDVEAAVHADVLDHLRRHRTRACGLGVEPDDHAGLAAALDNVGGQLGGLLTDLVVAEQLVTLRERHDQRTQVRVLGRDRAGELLRAHLGEAALAAGDLGVQLPQMLRRRFGVLGACALDVAGQARGVDVEVAVGREHVHAQLGQRVERGAEHDRPHRVGLALPRQATHHEVRADQRHVHLSPALGDADRHTGEHVGGAVGQQRVRRGGLVHHSGVGDVEVHEAGTAALLLPVVGRPHLDRVAIEVAGEHVTLVVEHGRGDAHRQVEHRAVALERPFALPGRDQGERRHPPVLERLRQRGD